MANEDYQEQDVEQQHLDPEQELQTYEEILEEYRRRQMVEHLTGPMISLVVHVVVVIACALLLAGKEIHDQAAMEFDIREVEIKPLDPKKLEELDEMQEEMIDEPVPEVERPDIQPETVDVTDTSDMTPEMASADMALDVRSMLQMNTSSPLKLKGYWANRSSAESRSQARREHGGNERTERAVLKALIWLKNHQSEDGSWSPQYTEAVTGLGLLTFLAHGETPNSEMFGNTVQKAIQYLIAEAEKQDVVGRRAYSHGIVAYALSEAYGLTKLPMLKPAMDKTIRRIIVGQQEPTGGYNYGYAAYVGDKKRWDLSVAAWQYQAMKAAHSAGCQVEGLEDAMYKGIEFLKEWTYKDGKFGYSSPGSGSWGMQGAGTLCLQLMGQGKSPEARAGVENIANNYRLEWNDEKKYALHGHPSYYWYYCTQAAFHGGRSSWRQWNRHFSDVLIRHQKEDGHWVCPGEDNEIGELDPYYSTTLNALSLMVYYRYLPTYKQPEEIARGDSDVFGDVLGEDDLDVEVQ